MSPEEMSRYIQFLFEQIQQKDAQHKELLELLAGIKEELKRANETISSNTSEQQRLSTLVLSLTNQLHEAQQTITDLARKNEDLQSSLRVSNKHRFGSSSQKRRSKTEDAPGRDDNKGDFDGTADSLNYNCHL